MATSAPPPPGMAKKPSAVPPARTLYVRQLPDKLQKWDLKRNLYMLFATYGVIIDIVAVKTSQMRGQAHVAFRDVDSATQAMRALQGFNFFGKEMQIHYAKSKSHGISKLDGTMKMPEVEKTEKEADQSGTKAIEFGQAPMKAVPMNAAEQERAKGTKRGRDEEEEAEEAGSEDEDAAMDVSDSDED